MKATSQAGAQRADGESVSFSVRTPNVSNGQREVVSMSGTAAYRTAGLEYAYSGETVHERCAGLIEMLGLRQYNPRTGLVTDAKFFDRAAIRCGSVCIETSGGTT
jgi:hypothetical protein